MRKLRQPALVWLHNEIYVLASGVTKDSDLPVGMRFLAEPIKVAGTMCTGRQLATILPSSYNTRHRKLIPEPRQCGGAIHLLAEGYVCTLLEPAHCPPRWKAFVAQTALPLWELHASVLLAKVGPVGLDVPRAGQPQPLDDQVPGAASVTVPWQMQQLSAACLHPADSSLAPVIEETVPLIIRKPIPVLSLKSSCLP